MLVRGEKVVTFSPERESPAGDFLGSRIAGTPKPAYLVLRKGRWVGARPAGRREREPPKRGYTPLIDPV